MEGRRADSVSLALADPSTEAHHATLTTLPPDEKGKSNLKVVELISPEATIELKNTGSLSWEWSFVSLSVSWGREPS